MLAVLTCLVLLAAAALWLGWMWLAEKRRADGLAGLTSALAGHAAGHADAANTPFELFQQAAAASFCWRKAATTAPASSPTGIPVPTAKPTPAPPKLLT